MTESKKLRIEFAPGCFNDFEGTQEELNQLIKHITVMAENGELDAIYVFSYKQKTINGFSNAQSQ